jgi:nucleoside-diphosphate-sugar epimerase
MKLFLTGAGGFLGSHLAAYWAASGHEVYGASRSIAVGPGLRRVIPFRLGDSMNPYDLEGMDMGVHLAYDRKASIAVNVQGTTLVYETAKSAGVPRQCFVSSYSARPDAIAEYGRLKHQLETYFLDGGQTIVRPGLVIGNGGLFLRNMRKILTSPLMPLLDGGRDLIPVVAMEDLAAAMTLLLSSRAGPYNLFNPELVTMRRFIETINRAARHWAFYFDIPLSRATSLLSFAETLRIKLPFDSDNLRALKQNQECIHESDLAALAPAYRTFEDMIADVIPR